MSVAIYSPAALAYAPRHYRVWVDASEPGPSLAHALDASYPVLAPSAPLRCALEQGDETARTFAVVYALELDAINARVFDALCSRARASGLILVSRDPSAAVVLRQYLNDWIACKANMRHSLYRRALTDAAIAGSAYQRAWSAGASHHQARHGARAAMRRFCRKPPDTTEDP